MLVITAGSIMHMLIAIVLLFAVFAVNGRARRAPTRVGIGSVADGCPAAEAGVQAGDIVVSIDGVQPTTPDDVRRRDPHATSPATRSTLVLERDGADADQASSALGANPTTGRRRRHGVPRRRLGQRGRLEQRVGRRGRRRQRHRPRSRSCGRASSGVVKVLNPVNIVDHLTGDERRSRHAADHGRRHHAGSAATIGDESGLRRRPADCSPRVNVFVGLFNLFPLLPFDGGHAAIATYERHPRSRSGRRYYRPTSRKLMPVRHGVIVVLAAAVHRPACTSTSPDRSVAERGRLAPCRSTRAGHPPDPRRRRCRSAATRRSRCSR